MPTDDPDQGRTCEGMADGAWRNRVLDALYGCVTAQEAQDALDAADAWVKAHPWDLDLRHVMEQAVLVLTAWDVMDQADRDATLERLGRTRK